uniref:Rhodopsin domain-containing protein n=1 Tax=Bionectria ochroleuca TaxID=29856 RepID=A0A8H7KFP1_BIOOC
MDQLPTAIHITPFPLKHEILVHVAVESMIQFFVFVVVGLRLFARSCMGAGLGLDDYMIIIALLLSCVVYGLMVALQVAGTGYEQVETMANIPTILLLTFITVPTYLGCLLFSKLSMLCFYLRIFETQAPRRLVFGTMILCMCWFVSHFLANVFICKPVPAQWKMELVMSGEGTCGDQIPIFQSMIISNMLTDLIIMILPMKIIWGLQMRFMEKIGLMTSFLLLGAVIVVSSVRVHYVSTVNMRADLTKTMGATELARFGSSGATKLSDEATHTIGGSGAYRSGRSKQNSRKLGRDDITLATFNADDNYTKYDTNVEAGSNPSLSAESDRKLAAHNAPDAGIKVHTQWKISRHSK